MNVILVNKLLFLSIRPLLVHLETKSRTGSERVESLLVHFVSLGMDIIWLLANRFNQINEHEQISGLSVG